MTEDHGESPNEKYQAAFHQRVMNRRDNTAHNTSQQNNARAWHQRLKGLETFPFAIIIIQNTANCDWQNSHNEDIQEHTYRVDLDNRTRLSVASVKAS